MAESFQGPVRQVSDVYGRRYRVGESDVGLTGRPRVWMIRLPWLAMLAVSLFQYGFAAALPALTAMNGWTAREGLLVFGLWVVCQAGVALPAARLFRRMRRRSMPLLLAGAVLCGVALATLAHAQSVTAVLLGYSVAGGAGVGLVYVACLGVVTEWFPERMAAATGVVSGAFGYGALPFVVVAGSLLGAGNRVLILDGAAVLVVAFVGVGGLLLRRPPGNWWPEHLDPQQWAVDRRLNRSIPNNMPALRLFSLRAAVRTGMLPLMFVVVVLAAAMAFFDLAFLARYAWQPIAVLAVATGLGRYLSSRLSDRLGRRRILAYALTLGGLAQFGLLAAVQAEHLVLVMICGGLAGVGTGAGYSLLVGLVRDWFGDEAALPGYGFVYTGKALGGVAGIGVVMAAPAPGLTFIVVGLLGLLGALLAVRLRQPGRPVLLNP
ncbi:MAG: MFS transporter [Actinoplanes sp.]